MVLFSMSACSRSITITLKGFSLNFSHFNQSYVLQRNLEATVRARGIYTHTRDTGIKLFDKNVKQLRHKGNWLPSYIDNSPDISQHEMEDLYGAFPEIVEDLTSWPSTAIFPLGNQRTRELLEYVTPWAPTHAGQTMMADRFYARKRRVENKVVSEQDEKARYRRAHQLAWCLELIIRPIYMNDDIIDGHQKRNGLPTWNSLPHIGLGAVNENALMSQGGYLLLHKYFGDQDYYSHLLQSAYESALVAQVGENEQKMINTLFDEGLTFERLAYFKGVLNAGLHPNISVIGAMMINGIRDLELERLAFGAAVECMVYATMVDDYGDCFEGELVNERKTSDIARGKQTWILFKANELGSPEQRERLKMNYGNTDAASIQNILQIYEELNIKEVVFNMAEETYRKATDKINQLPHNEIPTNIFHGINSHYRRCAQGAAARI